jgi:hypothetical protein
MMALFVLGGCTTVHVNSVPSGADVMASYHRGGFGWTEWGRECQTPCTFTTGNSVQLRIRWSDSTLSEIHQGRYRPFGATYDFNFDKSATVPIMPMKNGTNIIAGKAESAQQPSAGTGEAKIFTGKVEKVTPLLGGWKAPYNKIVVTDDKGTQETFFVMRATVITDASGKDFSGSGVKRDKKVEVKYSIITNGSSITNGKNQADSIKYLE